ncbi:MAG: hypothetical protein K2N63_14835 [Lachnospiraceae bacterium]|nr:hypothetical protein [Lachnospiraceae bacterium]
MEGIKRYRIKKNGEVTDKRLSLLALLVGGSIRKLGAVLAAMVLVETVLFTVAAQNGSGMESTLYNRLAYGVFLVALGLIFILLAHLEGVMGTKGGDTLRRLKLTGRDIFLVEAGYNFLCLVFVLIIQIWIAILAVKVWGGSAGKSTQGLFLAFYRIEFLHCLLPMQEIGKWLRNLLLLFALSLGAARGFWERDYVLPVLVFLITALWFNSGIGWNFTDFACILTYLLEVAEAVWLVWKYKKEA